MTKNCLLKNKDENVVTKHDDAWPWIHQPHRYPGKTVGKTKKKKTRKGRTRERKE